MSDERRQPKRKRSDSLASTPSPSAKREATEERHFIYAPVEAQRGQSSAALSPTSALTPALSTGDTQLRRSPTPVIPNTPPRDRLDHMYGLHPYGQGLDRPADKTSSGVLNVKSSENQEKYDTFLQQDSDEQIKTLDLKTIGDLQKLRDHGFDIKFSIIGILGEGGFGKVYRGEYGEKIKELPTTGAGSHMKDVKVGQPFAAKYVSYSSTSEDVYRLCHEMEKQFMKHIAHQNIVDIKVAINLGKKRYLVHKSDPNIKPIVSYDRMFLIMDLATSSLFDFCIDGHLTNRLAINFTRDVCAGMCYLHDMGVVHYDAHAGNVLIFKASDGQMVAKWADFGVSVWRERYKQWGVTIEDNEFAHIIGKDLEKLATVMTRMANDIIGDANGVDEELRRFENDLTKAANTSGQTLAKVLKNYERFRDPRNLSLI